MDFEGKKIERQKSEKGSIEKLKSLILTDAQYAEHPADHGEGRRAYIFELGSGGKKLLYFGSSHLVDPKDPMFEDIKARFDHFKPDMVYVEGMDDLVRAKDEVKALLLKEGLDKTKEEGEPLFALKLGIDAGADFESPEPNRAQEINYLVGKGLSKPDIFNYYAFRAIHGYLREHPLPSADECKKYLSPYLNRFRQASNWDPSELVALEQNVITNLDVTNHTFYREQVDPIPWHGKNLTATNEVADQCSQYRDKYIFERIAEGLKTHDKIFVVYGSGHAVKQEPALKALFSEYYRDRE